MNPTSSYYSPNKTLTLAKNYNDMTNYYTLPIMPCYRKILIWSGIKLISWVRLHWTCQKTVKLHAETKVLFFLKLYKFYSNWFHSVKPWCFLITICLLFQSQPARVVIIYVTRSINIHHIINCVLLLFVSVSTDWQW